MVGRKPRIEYRRALDELRLRLSDGRYPAGRGLPSERQLATDLGVARTTVRRLLATLVGEHTLDSEHRVVGGGPVPPAVAPSFGSTVLIVDDLPGLDPTYMHQPGWLERVLHATQLELRRAGFAVLSVHPRHLLDLPAHPPGALVGVVLGWNGGVVDLASLAASLRRLAVPVVAVGEEPAMAGFDRVWSDHIAGAEAATRWLRARGRRRILPMLPLRNQWQRDRLAGYQRAIADTGGVALAPLTMEHPDFGDEVGLAFWAQRTAEQLAPHVLAGIDAILALNDFEIPLLVHSLARLGKQANRDIDLIGYDHVWPEVTSGRFSTIGPLATVDKRNDRVGQAVVELLLGRIRGQLPEGAQLLAVPPQLVELEAGSLPPRC